MSCAVVLLVAAALLGVAAPVPARASCAGPQLSVGAPGSTPTASPYAGSVTTAAPLAVQPGETLAVAGLYFLAECNDVIVCAGGCAGCTGGDPSPPMRSVSLVLVSGDSEIDLGQQGASDELGAVRWDVTLPPDLRGGPALLEARGDAGVLVAVPLEVRA